MINSALFSFRYTFVQREPGESPNDRNDRAIRKTVQFYNDHLQKKSKTKSVSVKFELQKTMTNFAVPVVLITDDAENARKARADGLLAYNRE